MLRHNVAVAFAHRVREAGIDVATGTVITYAQALAALGLDHRDGVYWAGRATLVHRPEDIGAYDDAFASFWEHQPAAADPSAEPPVQVALEVDTPDPATGVAPIRRRPGDHRAVQPVRAAAPQGLRGVLARGDARGAPADGRPAPRRRAAPGAGACARRRRRAGPPRSPPHGAARAARRRRASTARLRSTTSERPRRIVLLFDVSGSMDRYARALLRFVHAAVAGRGRVEAFALGTRLTRLTRELATRDPDAALQRATGAVADWSGGTRLGDGLRAVQRPVGRPGHGPRRDRGRPLRRLGPRRARRCSPSRWRRLGRVAHRIIWVNPLKASPGYAPLAAGMAAALPYVRRLRGGHTRWHVARARCAEVLRASERSR